MEDPVLNLALGALVAVVIMAALQVLAVRRARAASAKRIADLEGNLSDLREELAVDKETNRELRHRLAQVRTETPTGPSEPVVDVDREEAIAERDRALEQLRHAQEELTHVTSRLHDREAKLGEYRDSLKEIRVLLEASDRARLGTITEDVPPEAGLSAAE